MIECGTEIDGANYVWVQYPRLNINLLHYHLDSICVKKGQKVNENTILDYTGQTGMATGVHLHLGMQYLNSNSYVDSNLYDYQETIVSKKDELVYVVQKGDTLTSIAKKYNTTWQNTFEWNKTIIGDNPNLIYPNQMLKIKI